MDDKWFTYVGEKLAQIERENQRRYSGLTDHAKALWCHPSLVSSGYWHHSDSSASSMCFDWDPQRFPTMYLAALRQATPSMIHRLATMPYRHNAASEDVAMDNQRILVARLLLLNLGDLLCE